MSLTQLGFCYIMKEATDAPGTWIHSRTDSSEEPQASGQSLANSNVDSWV